LLTQFLSTSLGQPAQAILGLFSYFLMHLYKFSSQFFSGLQSASSQAIYSDFSDECFITKFLAKQGQKLNQYSDVKSASFKILYLISHFESISSAICLVLS